MPSGNITPIDLPPGLSDAATGMQHHGGRICDEALVSSPLAYFHQWRYVGLRVAAPVFF
jgi:hypothetical protein